MRNAMTEKLRRLLSNRSTAATAFEIFGVIFIARGLALIYLPLMSLWLGASCFAMSYLLESTDRRSEAPRASAVPDDSPDDAFTGELSQQGEQTR